MGNNTYNVTVINESNAENQSNMKTFYDLNVLINGNTNTEVYLDSNYTFDVEFKGGISITRGLLFMVMVILLMVVMLLEFLL